MSSCAHGVDEQRCVECNPELAAAVSESSGDEHDALVEERHVVEIDGKRETIVVRRVETGVEGELRERYYLHGRVFFERVVFTRPQKVWRAARGNDGVIYAQ